MIDLNKKLIGLRLLELRADKPRNEVAEAVTISVSALQMYETGQRIPRDEIKINLQSIIKNQFKKFFLLQKNTKCRVDVEHIRKTPRKEHEHGQ